MPAKKKVVRRQPAIRQLAAYVFNPQSFDAQFSAIHTTLLAQDTSRNARMDTQDKVLEEIKRQVQATNGRVTKLENKWLWAVAWVTGAGVGVAGVMQYVFHLWKR